ncbi:MAG: DUF4012 domain-containing protein [Candidatus Roizmanbacteria bacterium]|nr:MAG: DUF4012 domain-containing protein [Candidatus Roizmanbacteria bacterium]
MKIFKKKNRRKLFLLVVVFLLIFAYFFIFRPAQIIQAKGKILVSSAKSLKSAFLKNDIDLARVELKDFKLKYQDFEKSAKSVYWLFFIPYVADFKNGVEAGNYLIKAGEESLDAIYPYADLIGFKKGTASFVERSAEDRLQTAVATLDKVLVKIDSIADNVNQAEIRISRIDSNRYPEKIGNLELRSQIITLKTGFEGLASLFVDSKPMLKKIPDIFGKDKEKTYLLLFQNDKELRATGGFLTAYAVFNIKDGKIRIEKSEDIYSLDNSISGHPVAPDKILSYHKGVSQFYIRDSNLSPDFVESIRLFESLYKKSSVRKNYDGIIAIDTKILVDMLTIFGDTEADGIRFSSNSDKRCDCPQVIYQLFDMVDRPVGYVKTNRKGILGDLMYALFYKAIGFSPSKYWGTLAQTMFKNLEEKHILLYFVDPTIQTSIEKLNYGGKINDSTSDYLHVNNVNFAGAKANLFVTQTIVSKTNFNSGQVEREVNLEYRNPYPHSDCNLERGGLCLNATLRDWIRVYVPKGSKLVSFLGSQSKVLTYDELGKTVFEGFLQVTPQGKSNVIVKYTLPASIDPKSYKLMIQKQSGTEKDNLKVNIDGNKIFDGIFDKDREFSK